MSQVIPLQYFDEYSREELQNLIDAAGRAASLRIAVERVIHAIHGLPDVLEADLQKIEVYVGRAAATVAQLRNRWWTRMDAFKYAPSTHAMVVTVTPTSRLREQRWERAAQLIVNHLENNSALCCSNALLGQSGRWPDQDDSLIYLVGRVRKGPAGQPATDAQVNAAVADLLVAAAQDAFSPDVVVAAGAAIKHRAQKEAHEVVYPYAWNDEDASEEEPSEVPESNCRAEHCERPARPGNYGFCGIHRPHLQAGQEACRRCGRAALPGNYGFCVRHRAYCPPSMTPCKKCGRPARLGNYGFCGIHRWPR